MTLAHWAASHRRSILFLLAAATLAGVFCIFSVPVALFPHIDFPRVSISLDAGDRPTQRVVNEITRPVEAAVKAVPGLREERSTTSRGSAEIDLNFAWGDDMDRKTLQVESALARVLPSLPQGTTFEVRRMTPTALYPVASYSLISGTVGQVDLRNIAVHELVPLLSAVPGVASVSVQGGAKREYRVDIHPDLLVGYHLSFDDVVKALSSSNILQVVGRVKDGHKMLLAISDTRVEGIDAIRHTIIRSGGDGIIELSDVATVKKSIVPQTSIIDEDGRPAVILQVFQQPDGNTVQVVRDVAAALAGFREKIPQGVTVREWYDQALLVVESAHSVRDAIFIGIGLAALVLYLFLRDAMITLTAVIAVPAVLSATVLLLYALGMSFNIMTLGGMAAAIGLIVDDAIVMIEQIVRHIGNEKEKRHENVRRAIRDFLPPLTGSSASTIIIFLPLAFLTGVTGAFFKALSLTMASALAVSYFVAWFAVPLLADHLAGSHGGNDEGGPLFRPVLSAYAALFGRFVKRPALALASVVILLALGGLAYLHVGSGFMPSMDEGGFIIDYVSPPGTSLKDTDALLQQV
ncbi:MAG: efflux RND transporter permease subunit, partial [Alphaproteobacteria bacterium]|nr:efflux RND transporter permease subunit [Alphaproteobacteria bacterium]